ncbi:MAG: TetR/AcrR family transcriptional regulator [Methylocella sp.]
MSDEADSKSLDGRAGLRDRVLKAAETTIAAGGLQSLKARNIAAEAGCAVGAIYNVFDNLDELILRVGSRTLSLLEAALVGTSLAQPRQSPAEELVPLARAYLDFARMHKMRWRALFEHRMAGGRAVPAWFTEDQNRLFLVLEAPLAGLAPRLSSEARALLARTLFSAVHGIVSLGLEEKLAPMPPEILNAQLEIVTRAFAAGLRGEA